VIGDLHGELGKLSSALESVNFDFSIDRLFALGDIVDRGPDSIECLKLIKKPWFHTVLGNHESMMMTTVLNNCDGNTWYDNGGEWARDIPTDFLYDYALDLEELPYTITVETKGGSVGLCHAQPPTRDWKDVDHLTIYEREVVLWSRAMSNMAGKGHAASRTKIKNVDKVYCGHTVFPEVTEMGNITFMDTGCGFAKGKLTILEISWQS
jgi:serine/threonine protein phosphatase 1